MHRFVTALSPGRWMARRSFFLLLCAGAALLAGCAAPAPFTIAALPDTQIYSKRHPDLFRAQTAWIRDNARRENIVFVTQLGDIVNDGARETDMYQWTVADESMSMLDGVVPWGVAIGNHDFDRSGDRAGIATTFIRYFGPQRFKNVPWYGGSSPSELSSYQLFAAGGVRFVILHLEAGAPDETLDWAQQVLQKHPNRAAIVSTHIYLHGRDGIGREASKSYRRGGNSGEQIWDKFVRRSPQVFLVLCAHQGRTDEYHQISINDAGRKVLEVLADYQKRSRGGEGFLRLMTFDLPGKQVLTRTYSPVLARFETDANSEFSLPLELPPL